MILSDIYHSFTQINPSSFKNHGLYNVCMFKLELVEHIPRACALQFQCSSGDN